jgi:hypothetical protein
MISSSAPGRRESRGGWIACALLTAFAAAPAPAETIYKCRSDSGSLIYSANPCRPGSRLEDARDYEQEGPKLPAPLSPPAKSGPDVAGAAAEEWPRRPSMEEARRQAAEAEERARLEAERNRQAETDPTTSLKCIELRRRIGRGGITLGHVMSEGCL